MFRKTNSMFLRTILIGAALLCCLTMAFSAPKTSKGAKKKDPVDTKSRAVYLWETSRPALTTLASFLKNNKITEVHLGLGWGAVSRTDIRWINSLRSKVPGLQIVALAGAGCDWVEPGNEDLAARWVTDKAASGVFDAYDLDIEPWSCPGWNTDRAATIAAYQDALTNAVLVQDEKPVYATITNWLDSVPVEDADNLAVDVINRTDGIIVMAFYDTYDKILDVAQTELDEARVAQKYMRIAVSVEPVGTADITARNTFADNGAAALNNALTQLSRIPGAAATDSYAGPMVQSHEYWRTLK